MGSVCRFVFVGLLAIFLDIARAENSVPVFVWNIDSDVDINPLKSINAEELVGRFSNSIDRKLVALFMQDELNVEDFKSGDLASLQAVAGSERTLYAPAVVNTELLPELLQTAGFQLVSVRSHEELPKSSVNEKTVLVIDLPTTGLGDGRSENVALNGNAMKEVFEYLQSQQADVVGILTARKNSQLKLDESRRRIARAAEKVGENCANFYNITSPDSSIYLYFEKDPVLRIKDADASVQGKDPWGNFTLTNPDTAQSVANTTFAELVLNYPNPIQGSEGNVLNRAKIIHTFALKGGYWFIKNTTVDYDATINGKSVSGVYDLVTQDISTPLGFSYHCTPTTNLASLGFKYPLLTEPKTRIIFEMNGFQLQPFRVRNNKFGDGYDCQGFFTEGIWAAILIGLVLAMFLAWAVSMLADIRTPDRYDDPKGKTITVTATD